jgi:hypothetical protein
VAAHRAEARGPGGAVGEPEEFHGALDSEFVNSEEPFAGFPHQNVRGSDPPFPDKETDWGRIPARNGKSNGSLIPPSE